MSRDTLSALVAVHEPALDDEIGSELAADGFDVHRAAGLAGCLARLASHRVDVLVLADPALCSDLRAGAAARTPIMLVIEGGAEDRVRGLRSGADDCVSRPIAGRELAARLRVIARRPRRPTPDRSRPCPLVRRHPARSGGGAGLAR
jgi:DNA-binding response OmpR family regulator